MEDRAIQNVRLNRTDDEIKTDIQRYCELARELGATDAQLVGSKDIPVDDRVALKCRIPKCFGYGTCANCPPHSLKPEEMRSIVAQFRFALVLKLDVPSGVIVRDRETIKERVAAYKSVFDMINRIESEAFYDGYYLAVGFGAGSCKSTYCYNVECSVLSGERCRLALRARPSMEAVGIDCYRFAVERGWDMLPIGSDAQSGCISHGTLMGLVLVS